MESRENCTYIFYPRRLSDKDILLTMQSSFLVSTGEPSLSNNAGIQTYTEEDVKNFGINEICQRVISDANFEGIGCTDCVVLKVPKAYLGSDPESGLEMSPIFDMVKSGEFKGINVDSFFVKNNLMLGVYSGKYKEMITNPNYSPVCDCKGVLSIEQKNILKSKIDSGDIRSGYYEKMLDIDRRIRENETNTLGRWDGKCYKDCFNSELADEISNLYMAEMRYSGVKTPACSWRKDDDIRHKMFADEFNGIIADFKSQGM